LNRGVQILRAHDVAETIQAIAVWRAIETAGPAPAALGARVAARGLL
ncbi:MAG: hypothetical protein IH805_01465, partial [Proteobacteria bacterium]|nr:hypothetical protein [Pseudomonadota bacterium]